MTLREELAAAESKLRAAQNEHDRIQKLLRYEWQTKDMTERNEGTAENPVRWLGDIGSYCEDMAYHTIRLGRAIHGMFNGKPIVSNPRLRDYAIAEDCYNQWRKHWQP